MNKEQVVAWARKAGMERVVKLHSDGTRTVELPHPDLLERFAHLVYESVFRDANIAASKTILDAAVLEERERCCKIIYSMAGSDNVAQRTVDAIRRNP